MRTDVSGQYGPAEATAHEYEGSAAMPNGGTHWLSIYFGDSMGLALHDMKGRDLWHLVGQLEAAAMSVCQPDSWLERPVAGEMRVEETPEGPKIVVDPSDNAEPEYIDDAGRESAAERARRVRLINHAEALLELVKVIIAPVESAIHLGHELALLRRRALELVNTIEGSDLNFAQAQTAIYAERKAREILAGDAVNKPDPNWEF